MSWFSKAFKSVTSVITNPVQALSNTINLSNDLAANAVKAVSPSAGNVYQAVNNATAPVISTIGGVGAGATLLPVAAGAGAGAVSGTTAAGAAPSGFLLDTANPNWGREILNGAGSYFKNGGTSNAPNISSSPDKGSFFSGPGLYYVLGGGILIMLLVMFFKR